MPTDETQLHSQPDSISQGGESTPDELAKIVASSEQVALIPGAPTDIDFADYSARCDQAFKDQAEAGENPVRVKIEAAPFKAWCDANNVSMSREAVLKYAMAIAVAGK